jgi:hypothetical protein
MGQIEDIICEKWSCQMRTYKFSVDSPSGSEAIIPFPPLRSENHFAAPWCGDHLPVSDVDRDVVDVGGGAVVDEVADLEWFPGREHRSGFVLCLRGAGQVDPGGEVGGVGESGAVPSAFSRAVSTPEVGDAELALGVEDGGVAGVGGGGVAAEAAAGRAVLVNRALRLQSVGAVSWALKSWRASVPVPMGAVDLSGWRGHPVILLGVADADVRPFDS